jgi:hypothetical protein
MSASVKDSVRNSSLSDMITAMGGTAVLVVFSGAPTGKAAGAFNADPTGQLVEIALAATPFGTPSGGVASLASGPRTGTATAGTNTAPLSYRIKTATGGGPSTVIVEGDCDVNATPTSGKLSLVTNVTSGQVVSVSSFSITAGNA